MKIVIGCIVVAVAVVAGIRVKITRSDIFQVVNIHQWI